MAIEPTKVNTGADRPVTQINVLNAENRNVEREQLNRILSTLDSRISAVENNSSSGGGGSTGDITITADATQINVVQSSNNYDLSLATGGVTTSILADDAVTTAKLADTSVTYAKIQNSAGLSVIGRSANSTGNVADITAGTDGHVLRRSGTTLGFGTIPNTSVTGLGTAAVENIGTSGANVPLLNGNNTWSGTNGFQAVTATTLITTGQADLATGDGGGIRHTLGGATLEFISRGDLGFCIVGSDTDHDVLLRRNNSERARLTSAGASITGTLSTTGNVTLGDASTDAHTANGGIEINPRAGVYGLKIGTDPGSGNTASGRLVWESGGAGAGVAILNVNGEMDFRTGATYGSSTGTKRMGLSTTGLSITGTLSTTTTTSTGDYYQVTDVHTIDANTGTESLTVNWSNGSVQKCQRGGNFTINTITGPSEYVANCTLYVYDTSTGAIITRPSNMRFICAGGAIGSGVAGTYIYYGHWDGVNFLISGYARPDGDQRPS